MAPGRSHTRLEPAEDLARHGLRATRQRIAVLARLREHRGHPTALEIHRNLVAEHPNLSPKTVYETLDALVGAGLASTVTHGGGPLRYEARHAAHYHALCRVCGRLLDMPANADGPIRGRAVVPEGFRIEQIHVTMEGRCLRCQDEI